MWIIALILLAVVVWWWLNRDESKQNEQARDVLRDTEEHMRQALRRAMERLEQALEEVDDAPAKPAPQADAPMRTEVPVTHESKPDKVEEAKPAPVAEEAPAAPEPAPTAPQEADDLTKINGIGPAYRDILHRAGVTTFAALASLTPEQIDDIIRKGGGRRAPSSATWAEQARQALAKDTNK